MREFQGSIGRSAFVILLVSAVALFGAASARGQGAPIIRSIDVQYSGPATLAKERILAQMRTTVGQPYSDQTVEDDIRNLYKSGSIQNVRIFAQPEGDGVKVIVAVQTRAVVREIVIDGAQRVKAKKLRKEIAIKLNAPVNEDELQKGRQKIIDIYQSKGFTDVNVEFRVEPIEEKRGTARVVYTIGEGAKGAVSRIHFEGNEHFSEKILRKQMKTKGKSLISFIDKSGRLDEAQLQQDLDSIKEFYQNHGYIDAEVKDVHRERKKGGPLIITVAVTEGIQYHVNKLTVSGYKETTEQKIRALLKMKEGGLYSPKSMHDDAKAIADAYGSGGYVDLIVLPEGTPAGAGRIDVHYKIEEGTRSFLERINIIGNTRTKDKVIRREILIAPGDVFNTVRVDTTKKRLENLGFFSKVETYPETTGVEGRKDLVVQVEEKRTGSLNFGAGFSTVDQLVGFVELTQGNFDIMNWPGFTGAGQKFRARAQLGTQRKDFIIALTEPYFLDRRLSLSGQAFYNEANYLSSVYDQRSYGGSVEIRKPLFWYMYMTLGYQITNFEIFNVVTGVSPEIRAEEGITTKSEVLTSLVFDRRDNPFLTRSGERVSLTPYVAGGPLGGTEQIYGWDLEASKYFRLPGDLILLFNAEAATVDVWDQPESHTVFTTGTAKDASGNPLPPPPAAAAIYQVAYQVANVPIFDRLYLGGSNNLRGFNFRDISPRDFNKQPIGGQSMARGTVELTFPIIEKARGAVFYDVGFVNPDAWDFSLEKQSVLRGPDGTATIAFNSGVPFGAGSPVLQPGTRRTFDNIASDFGFGVRLDLPIGPLRLDYGIPIQSAGKKSGHLNFSVGYQF
jgi:outer membrane protein insertion porin family